MIEPALEQVLVTLRESGVEAIHGRRLMNEEIAGFQTSPKAQVQAAFEEIARRSMHDLFLHPSMPVYVSDFTLFEGQWTGCVITPWMLSAVIFPGPDQLWPLRKVSEKLVCNCRMAL